MSGFSRTGSDNFSHKSNHTYDQQKVVLTPTIHREEMYLSLPMIHENQPMPNPTMYAPYVLMFIPQPPDYNQFPQNQSFMGYPNIYHIPEGYQQMRLMQPAYPLVSNNIHPYNSHGLINMNPNQMISRDVRAPRSDNTYDFYYTHQNNLIEHKNKYHTFEPMTTTDRDPNLSCDQVSCTLSCISDNTDSIIEAQIPEHILNSKAHNDSLVYDPSDTNESFSTSTTASTNFVKHSTINDLVSKNRMIKGHKCNIAEYNCNNNHLCGKDIDKEITSQSSIKELHALENRSYKLENIEKSENLQKEFSNEGVSFGTKFHAKGTCNPCRFEWTRGCHVGIDCRFCHHESHAPEGCKRIIPSEGALDRNLHLRNNILNNLSKSAKQWRAKRIIEN